jgi:hypothetical protein
MTLSDLIATHRDMYRADMSIPKLVSRQPPTSLDRNSGVTTQEPGAATGMAMSGRLLKLLGHPEGYGADFPWLKALWLLRVECRRHHPHHRSADRPYWRGALCYEAVKLVCIGGDALPYGPLTTDSAMRILKLDHIEPLLRGAFREIETIMDDFRDRAAKRERQLEAHALPVNAAAPPAERHDQGGMHRLDCPKCKKGAAA